jgi:hypothetical protein
MTDSNFIRFCPWCGADMRPVPVDHKDWGAFCQQYREEHDTEWFLCSGQRDGNATDCNAQNFPLVLHHPVYGWDHRAGDSWAIGYVK